MSGLEYARAERERLVGRLAEVDAEIARLETLEAQRADWDPLIAALQVGQRVRVVDQNVLLIEQLLGPREGQRTVIEGVVSFNHPDQHLVYVKVDDDVAILYKGGGGYEVQVPAVTA